MTYDTRSAKQDQVIVPLDYQKCPLGLDKCPLSQPITSTNFFPYVIKKEIAVMVARSRGACYSFSGSPRLSQASVLLCHQLCHPSPAARCWVRDQQ